MCTDRSDNPWCPVNCGCRQADDFAPIAAEIAAELTRQDARWGEQNHPPVHGAERHRQWAGLAETVTAVNDMLARVRRTSWDLVLLEEVCEALAEADPDRYEEELIQVAAVAVQMIRSSRRARARGAKP